MQNGILQFPASVVEVICISSFQTMAAGFGAAMSGGALHGAAMHGGGEARPGKEIIHSEQTIYPSWCWLGLDRRGEAERGEASPGAAWRGVTWQGFIQKVKILPRHVGASRGKSLRGMVASGSGEAWDFLK